MIRKIFHLSDIHIRTNQYHDLYREQLQLFIDEVSQYRSDYNYDELRIVITGDIFHQKIVISNEQTLFASWLFGELVKICPVVIIPGNHDFLEKNHDRIDSITPIVELLGNKNIKYFKDWGVYQDDGIKWVVYSQYQENRRPDFKKEDNDTDLFVGLFHGPIQGMSTNLGYVFDGAYDRLNFVDLDLLLCGDIHTRQIFTLPNGGHAIMIGSFVQQDFAETMDHHGYGIYDVESNEYTFHDIPSNSPFMHFKIKDIKDIDDGKEVLVNAG